MVLAGAAACSSKSSEPNPNPGMDGGAGDGGVVTASSYAPTLPDFDFINCEPESSGSQTVPEGSTLIAENFGWASQFGAKIIKYDAAGLEGKPYLWTIGLDDYAGDVWSVQLRQPTEQAITKGDVLLAEFYIRCESVAQESGECRTTFTLERTSDYSKSAEAGVSAASEWKKVFIPFTAADTLAVGDAVFGFQLGYANQTIQIADLKVHNFGSTKTIEDMPKSPLSYRGMEKAAAWRTAAWERILELRTEEIKIRLVDASGKAMANTEIAIEQTGSEFLFGTALASPRVNAGEQKYLDMAKELFDTAVLENALKWQPLAGDWGSNWSLDSAISAMTWVNENMSHARGHVLVWPGDENLPKAIVDQMTPGNEEVVRKLVLDHIAELATAMKGKVDHWDVMNEPYTQHTLIDYLGKAEVLAWFEAAKAADPDARRYINDYAILSGGGTESPHRADYESWVKYLVDNNAPFDGVGLQGHFGGSLTAPEDMLTILDRFGSYGKNLLITEYDIVMEDENLAACFTKDFIITLMSQKNVEGFLAWGFWDGAHWKENAPFYRKDWSEKPAGTVYRRLVKDVLHTNQKMVTDSQGEIQLRTFRGAHQATIGGVVKEFDIQKDAQDIELKL